MEIEKFFVKRLLKWFAEHGRKYPWRETKDPYRVLVAEIMLQRTKSEQVADIYPKFMEKYPNPAALASASLKELERDLHPLGLRWRVSKIWNLGKALSEKYNGSVPDKKELLLSLPGVGEYVASAVMCFAYGKDVPIIDANVCRVVKRVFNLKPVGEARRNKKFIGKIYDIHRHVPPGKSAQFNWAILDFAASICMPRKPQCPKCPLNEICQYPQKSR